MIATDCICTRVRRGARALTALYDAALAPADMNVAQFSLLRHIERMGPVGISDLAQATGHERSTLARTLRPLARAGLIDLRPGADRRKRMASLTGDGRAAIARALPCWENAQREAHARLGAHQRATLFGLLQRFEAP